MKTTVKPKSKTPLIDGFRATMKPPTPQEETLFFVGEALRELQNEKRTADENHRRAMRCLACVPAVNARLSEGALNEILGRHGAGA
ncbi:MAG: hypothetical protein WEB53_09895 [Akkermansiaceae bacterium]